MIDPKTKDDFKTRAGIYREALKAKVKVLRGEK